MNRIMEKIENDIKNTYEYQCGVKKGLESNMNAFELGFNRGFKYGEKLQLETLESMLMKIEDRNLILELIRNDLQRISEDIKNEK